jgi:hypothetical protein
MDEYVVLKRRGTQDVRWYKLDETGPYFWSDELLAVVTSEQAAIAATRLLSGKCFRAA